MCKKEEDLLKLLKEANELYNCNPKNCLIIIKDFLGKKKRYPTAGELAVILRRKFINEDINGK